MTEQLFPQTCNFSYVCEKRQKHYWWANSMTSEWASSTLTRSTQQEKSEKLHQEETKKQMLLNVCDPG